MAAERVVPEVLDEGAAVRVRAGFAQLLGAEPAESLLQQSGDPMVPGRVNRTQVRDHRVRGERPRTRESTAERKHANDRAGPWRGRNLASHSTAPMCVLQGSRLHNRSARNGTPRQ